MTTVTPEKADILRQALQKLFGVTVTLDEVDIYYFILFF